MPLPLIPRPTRRPSHRSHRSHGPATVALLVLLVLVASLAASAGVVPGAQAAQTARPDPPALTAGQSVARTKPVADVPVPAVPRGRPDGIEDLARYVPADSCDPHGKPGTVALARLLAATYDRPFGIDRTCGTDPLPTSEHYDGRALDFFLDASRPAQRAEAKALISWLFATDAAGHPYANARRLGVMYLIWDNRIWGSYRAADGWRPYSRCASTTSSAYDTSCHRDHVHVSLSWEGAMGRTSFWADRPAPVDYGPCREADLNWAAPYTGRRSRPCPSYARVTAPAGASPLLRTLTTYSGMVLSPGSTGPVVTAVQQAIGVAADGSFGPVTRDALGRWQSAHGTAASGVVDAPTWRALLHAVATRTAHPELTAYAGSVLRTGSHGPAVTALQHRLHRPETGRFGSGTRSSVRTFQRTHHLGASGVVGPRTWKALGA